MERIRFSSNQNIREGESNFDEKNVEEVFNLCSTEQSCINIGITCYKIGTLVSTTLTSAFGRNRGKEDVPTAASKLLKTSQGRSFIKCGLAVL